MNNQSPYDFYEIVTVNSIDPEHAEINGCEGVILGKARHDDGEWGYAVFIHDDKAAWDLPGRVLESTGEFADPDEV